MPERYRDSDLQQCLFAALHAVAQFPESSATPAPEDNGEEPREEEATSLARDVALPDLTDDAGPLAVAALDVAMAAEIPAHHYATTDLGTVQARYQRALVFCFVNQQLPAALRIAYEMRAVRPGQPPAPFPRQSGTWALTLHTAFYPSIARLAVWDGHGRAHPEPVAGKLPRRWRRHARPPRLQPHARERLRAADPLLPLAHARSANERWDWGRGMGGAGEADAGG